MAPFSQKTADDVRGIARHDPAGVLAGTIGGALEVCQDDLLSGRHDYDRSGVASEESFFGSSDAFTQTMALTPGHTLVPSNAVLVQAIGLRPSSFHRVVDFGCEGGSMLCYVSNYLRCPGVGFEIVLSCAAIARWIANHVKESRPSSNVTIFEADFMTFPPSAEVERATVALLMDFKYDPAVVSVLVDKLILHCPDLSVLVKVLRISSAQARHFEPEEVVWLRCSWSNNPVRFLIYRKTIPDE